MLWLMLLPGSTGLWPSSRSASRAGRSRLPSCASAAPTPLPSLLPCPEASPPSHELAPRLSALGLLATPELVLSGPAESLLASARGEAPLTDPGVYPPREEPGVAPPGLAAGLEPRSLAPRSCFPRLRVLARERGGVRRALGGADPLSPALAPGSPSLAPALAPSAAPPLLRPSCSLCSTPLAEPLALGEGVSLGGSGALGDAGPGLGGALGSFSPTSSGGKSALSSSFVNMARLATSPFSSSRYTPFMPVACFASRCHHHPAPAPGLACSRPRGPALPASRREITRDWCTPGSRRDELRRPWSGALEEGLFPLPLAPRAGGPPLLSASATAAVPPSALGSGFCSPCGRCPFLETPAGPFLEPPAGPFLEPPATALLRACGVPAPSRGGVRGPARSGPRAWACL